MAAKLIYLDSNDFSDLSKPEDQLSTSDKALLSALRRSKSLGHARFFISPVHVCEAIHASHQHKDAAVARAKLMQELGAGNILRFPLSICEIELKRAFAGSPTVKSSLEEITSKSNEWFGVHQPLDDLVDRRKEINDQVSNALRGRNRKDRRRLQSELDIRKKDARAKIRSLVKEGLRKGPQSNIPMSLMNPNLTLDWYLGDATDHDFRSHSVGLLSDPYLLFKHLIDEIGHRERLYGIIRNQGKRWVDFIDSSMSQLAPLLANANSIGLKVDLRDIMSTIASDAFWRETIGSLAETDLTAETSAGIIEAKDKSPSTSVLLHGVLETLFVRLQSTKARIAAGNLQPAKAKISDYGDFLHAVYAPYFDIFRCDSRFASVLSLHKDVRPKLVPKRSDLMSLLQQA